MTDMEKNLVAPCPSIHIAPPLPSASSSGKERRLSCSSVDSLKKGRSTGSPDGATQDILLSKEEDDDRDDRDDRDASTEFRRPGKIGTFTWPIIAIVVLGWWVSSLVIPRTRHRWIPQSLWAWFFVLVIVFRFVPATLVSRPVSAIWTTIVLNPVSKFPYRGRLALLWLCAVAITFGSAFGLQRPEGTAISDRVISLAGVYFFQLAIYGLSKNRGAINWIRIPISIILQQALALFVLKSSAGFALFAWFNTAVADFMTCAIQASALIFDVETTGKGWFFITGLSVIIFVGSFMQMLYFFNWMQWLTKHFAWFGQKVLGASGAETFVAIWSPWFGQANSAILIGPYIERMTDTELLAVMTTSMSSVSSLMIGNYATKLAIPLRSLLAQSAMVIPASIINAKMAFPEADPEKPVTRSRQSTCAARKKLNLRKAHGLIDSLTDGALVGLKVAGSVLANFFAILALLVFTNALLVWIFRGFGVKALDVHQVIAGPIFPLTFFLGVPRNEIFDLAYLISSKLLVSSDFAYAALAKTMAGPTPFSPRGFAVISFALANTASLGYLGTQIGAMVVFAPSRKSTISHGVLPALLVSTLTTLQTAAVAASVL